MKRKTTERKALTYEQAQEHMTILCATTTELKQMEATIEAEQNAIVEAYAPQVQGLLATIEATKTLLERYASENKEQWPKKQLILLNGSIGFKTAPPKLVLGEGYDWDMMAAHLETHYPHLTTTTVVADKQAIIKAKGSEEIEALCGETGLTIVQDENFYCKPAQQKLQSA